MYDAGARALYWVRKRALLTAVDLFCGAGGLSYGFALAGVRVGAAVDADPVAAQTYSFPAPRHARSCRRTSRSLTGARLAAVAGGPVDLVIGGPSCQGFSTHGKRDPDDPRNYLFTHFVRLVAEIRPPWVVMENVKGLLTYERGRYRAAIHDSFRRIGYRIDSQVLQAAEFGVPQFRQRLFFIATRTDSPVTFPTPTHCPPDRSSTLGLKPFLTVQDAIGDLASIGCEGESSKYAGPATNPFQRWARRRAPRHLTLHRARRVSDHAMSIITRVPEGRRHSSDSAVGTA